MCRDYILNDCYVLSLILYINEVDNGDDARTSPVAARNESHYAQ